MIILDVSQLKQHTCVPIPFLWLFTTNTNNFSHTFEGFRCSIPHWQFPNRKSKIDAASAP